MVLIINFGELGAAEDLRFRQNAFDTIFFSSMHIFLSLPKNEIQKKLRNGPPYCQGNSTTFARTASQLTRVIKGTTQATSKPGKVEVISKSRHTCE